MALELQGRQSLDIQFGGLSFPFDTTQGLKYLHMCESSTQVLPSLSVSLRDNSRWLARNGALDDGVVITVRVSSGADEKARTMVFRFRETGHKEESRQGDIVFTIDGWLDVPSFMTFSPRKPVRGTSSFVLSSIANDCGLVFRGAGTNDAQVWYPQGKPLYAFAADTAKHGWGSDTSCLALAVSLDGSLIYADITSMQDPAAVLGVLDVSTPGVLPVTAFEPDTASGAHNVTSGYGNEHVEQSVVGDAQHTRHTGVATRTEAGALQLNAQLRSAQARVTSGPLQVGNGHESHARAAYQNRRVAHLFSVTCSAVVPVLTGLRSLDTVLLRTDLASAAGSLSAYAGLYRVTRRVVWIVPGFVVEKLTLARRTLSSNSATAVAPVASPTTTTVAVTAIAPKLAAQTPTQTSALREKVAGVASQGLAIVSTAGQALVAFNAAKAAAQATINAVASAAHGMADSVLSKVNGSAFSTRFDAVTSTITGLRDQGLAEIAAAKAANPYVDQVTLTAIVSNYAMQITATINDNTPPLTREASSAQASIDAATSVLASNPWAPSASVLASATKTLSAQASLAGAAGAAALAQAQASLSQTQAAVSAAATAKQTSVTAAVTAVQGTLANWSTRLIDARDAAYTAMVNAAVAVPPPPPAPSPSPAPAPPPDGGL